MIRFRRASALPALLLVTALTQAACSTTQAPAPAGQGGTASTAAAATTDGLSGEELLAKSAGLSGTTVTLGRCSLLTTPGSDGSLACRVLDKGGNDIKDSNGLPVDIFVKEAELSPDARAVVAGCAGFCTVQISGKLDRATDGTGYLSMTDVALKPVS